MIGMRTAERERTTLVAPEITTSPLRRYARWQLRDFVRNRAVWLAPLALLGVWFLGATYDPSWLTYAPRTPSNRQPGMTEPEFFRQHFFGVIGTAGVIGSFIASYGLVSRDRERGLQRFLFARPLRIWRFYVQAFLIHGAGLLAIASLTCALAAIICGRAVPFGAGLAHVAASYLVFGGLTFLLSTLVRFDFAIAAVISALTMPLHAVAEHVHGFWGTVARVVSWPLPPVDALAAIVQVGEPQRMSAGAGFAVCLAYGAAYVAGAVAVLRKRSIST